LGHFAARLSASPKHPRAPERPDVFRRQSLISISNRMQRPLTILAVGGISI